MMNPARMPARGVSWGYLAQRSEEMTSGESEHGIAFQRSQGVNRALNEDSRFTRTFAERH